MKSIIAIVTITLLCSSVYTKEDSMLITAPEDYVLSQKDFDSLITYATFNLGKTSREAIKDMATCVYNAGRLGWEIYQLVQAFNITKVPSIIKRTITCVNTCQSFKYLTLTRTCGDSVKRAASNLSSNANLYQLLKDPSRIKTCISQLKSDLLVIEKACVATLTTLALE